MPVVMSMRWDGVTVEQYQQARAKVGWEVQEAPGGQVHVAWFEDGALRVVDVWDSAEAFEEFTRERLMPGIADLGMPGEPQVSMAPAHAMFVAKQASNF